MPRPDQRIPFGHMGLRFAAIRNDSGDWLGQDGNRYDVKQVTRSGSPGSYSFSETTGTALTDSSGDTLLAASASGGGVAIGSATADNLSFPQLVAYSTGLTYSPPS